MASRSRKPEGRETEMDRENTPLENAIGILFIIFILLAFGICGGIEQGTIPF